eukprot:scaffold8105_cov112-Isochrysis_galbana.AAC.2
MACRWPRKWPHISSYADVTKLSSRPPLADARRRASVSSDGGRAGARGELRVREAEAAARTERLGASPSEMATRPAGRAATPLAPALISLLLSLSLLPLPSASPCTAQPPAGNDAATAAAAAVAAAAVALPRPWTDP